MNLTDALMFVVFAAGPVGVQVQEKPTEGSAAGWSTQDTDMHDMSQMDRASQKMGEQHSMHMQPATFLEEIVYHSSSGTSAEPNSTPTPMLMARTGKWSFMFHANVFLGDLQQSSARGADRFFPLIGSWAWRSARLAPQLLPRASC